LNDFDRLDVLHMSSREELAERLATETNKYRQRRLATQLGTALIRDADRKERERRKPPPPLPEPARIPNAKWHRGLGDLKKLIRNRRATESH
jgi:hypothetical protein